MGKHQSGKDKVLASLKEKGPQTVAELVASTGLVKERVRYAVDGLAWSREIHCSHEMRQIWNGQAHIFVYGPGPENEEPDFYRLRVEHQDATAENQRTVERIRNSYIPGIFDPFRVLRVQVGGIDMTYWQAIQKSFWDFLRTWRFVPIYAKDVLENAIGTLMAIGAFSILLLGPVLALLAPLWAFLWMKVHRDEQRSLADALRKIDEHYGHLCQRVKK